MAKTKDSFFITGNSLPELVQNLNFNFARLADRMDQIEGIRGTASIESDLVMNNNQLREVGGGSMSDDGARLQDLQNQDIETLSVSGAATLSTVTIVTLTVSGVTTVTNIVTSGDALIHGDVKVYDASGNLIHSLE